MLLWRECAFLATIFSSTVYAADQLIDPLSKDNSPQCQCYLASGPDPGYFQYHRFWDFRNISSDGNNTYTQAPALVNNITDPGDEPITSSYFNTSSFVADWDIQAGGVAHRTTLKTFLSAQNLYISRNSTSGSTYLTLRTYRLPSYVSTAEIDSNQRNLLYSSIRVRARVIPNGLRNASAPSAGSTALNNAKAGSNSSHPVNNGAVFGAFTYHNDEQESDIEILTSDPTSQIHYSNQPDFDPTTQDTVPGASTQDTLPNNLVYTEWIDHRIDWYQGVSRWYVNNQLVLNKTKNVPTDHSGFILNLWSDGGTWSGNMSIGSQVTVGIEYIDMVFNVSGSVDGSGNLRRSEDNTPTRRDTSSCHVGCKIDGVQNVGFPEVAYNVSSMASTYLTHNSNSLLTTLTVTILSALVIVLA